MKGHCKATHSSTLIYSALASKELVIEKECYDDFDVELVSQHTAMIEKEIKQRLVMKIIANYFIITLTKSPKSSASERPSFEATVKSGLMYFC